MNPLLAARARAYLRDCRTYLVVAAGTVPFGLLFHQQGFGQQQGFVLAISAVPPVVASVIAVVAQGAGRGLHDRLAGTVVVRTAAGPDERRVVP